MCAALLLATASCGKNAGRQPPAPDGRALFETNCLPCHRDGGNIVNPGKTLHRQDLEQNGIRRPADIVRQMRHPGPGMPAFGSDRLSDEEARAIADYVMGAF